MEVWKDIIGYEGIYQISNLGRVKSLERFYKSRNNNNVLIKEKILIIGKRAGYPYIELNSNGLAKKFNIHRLLAIHFIPNPHNLPIVEHLNDIKTDLRLENLMWSTFILNNNRAISNGVNKGCVGEKQGRSILKEKDVLEIRAIGKNMKIKEIALIYNVIDSNIRAVLNRYSWKHI